MVSIKVSAAVCAIANSPRIWNIDVGNRARQVVEARAMPSKPLRGHLPRAVLACATRRPMPRLGGVWVMQVIRLRVRALPGMRSQTEEHRERYQCLAPK